MSVLSNWKARLVGLKKAEREAKDEHTKAQAALEVARAKDLHPRAVLVAARDRATAKLLRARADVAYAKRVIARHTGVQVPHPERVYHGAHSSRHGVTPRLIVLHITVSHNRPGLGDIDAIGHYFENPANEASSHVINDAEGQDGRCVPDSEKAWTCAAFNSLSLNLEQIEYSDKRTRAEWLAGNAKQLDNTAQWVAFWSVKFGIPIKHSTVSGVCEHRELGAAGGGHSDCGVGYPMDVVLEKARGYASGMKVASP